jgi:heme oxygenase
MNEKPSVSESISPAQEFLKNLRQSTDALHKNLESLPLSSSLMKDDVSLADYAFYLGCMKSVIAFYDEVILKEISSIIPQADSRKKLAAINADLEYLKRQGVSHKPVLPLSVLPSMKNTDMALGMAYVIEGSTLGGRVILKHVNERLKLNEHGTTFFNGYQANTGAMWKEFLDALTTYAVKHDHKKIIEGAVDGFKMIYHHFLENGTSR